MSEIRLLFVSLPGMLSGILRVATRREPDLRIVEEVKEIEGAAAALERSRADVVVVGSEGGVLPRECARLMYRHPTAGILAMSLDGSTTTLYRLRPQAISTENASIFDVVEAIRELSGPPAELED